MQIFIHAYGQRNGPVTIDQINRQLREGLLPPDAMAWFEGCDGWIPLRNVPGVVMMTRDGTISLLPPPLPPSRTEPLAICSLVFGLCGLLCCGLLTGLPAIICGHLALASIRKDPRLAGRGLALSGLIIGYVGFVGGLLYVFIFGGIAAFQALAEQAAGK